MQLLSSSIAPIKSKLPSYSETFIESFFDATRVSIVVGYVAEDALVELRALIEQHENLQQLNLLVGMAKFDGLFRSQFDALLALDEILSLRAIGRVSIAVAIPVHAKAAIFQDGNSTNKVGLIGSSNLTGLIQNYRQYELDVRIEEPQTLVALETIVSNLYNDVSKILTDVLSDLSIKENPNLILEGVPNVEKVDADVFKKLMTTTSFDIPVKTTPKSNLNVYFGKGREHHNYLIPRPWYEVELIVSTKITRLPGYPQAGGPDGEFKVITDDGWKFNCQVQGANSKNFRSKDDLKTLGKWLKERLQNSGALKIGEPVTDDTLKIYGRTTLKFTKLNQANTWFLDFESPNVP